MSMLTIDAALECRPPPQSGCIVFYFSYAYDDVVEFPKRFPTATALGVTWLGGWTWHINTDGI